MTARKTQGCPECPHCQAKEAAAADCIRAATVLANATRRPWQQPHYGEKLTCVVDWFDGNWVGERAKSRDEAVVPRQIKDPQSWLEGFAEGWEDAEKYRAMQIEWRIQKTGAA